MSTAESDEGLCCKKNLGGVLIFCDACEGWFHIGCVGIEEKEIPKGKYTCPGCIKKHEKLVEKRSRTIEKRKMAPSEVRLPKRSLVKESGGQQRDQTPAQETSTHLHKSVPANETVNRRGRHKKKAFLRRTNQHPTNLSTSIDGSVQAPQNSKLFNLVVSKSAQDLPMASKNCAQPTPTSPPNVSVAPVNLPIIPQNPTDSHGHLEMLNFGQPPDIKTETKDSHLMLIDTSTTASLYSPSMLTQRGTREATPTQGILSQAAFVLASGSKRGQSSTSATVQEGGTAQANSSTAQGPPRKRKFFHFRGLDANNGVKKEVIEISDEEDTPAYVQNMRAVAKKELLTEMEILRLVNVKIAQIHKNNPSQAEKIEEIKPDIIFILLKASKSDVPNELLCDIFQFIDGKLLLCHPLLTCKKWLHVIKQHQDSILPLPLTIFEHNVNIDVEEESASINVTSGRDSWDKSVGRPNVDEAVEQFWNKDHVLAYVHLTASRKVYETLKEMSVKCGCVVRICRLVIQFYREEFDFLDPELFFFHSIVNPLRLVFIERFDDMIFATNIPRNHDQQHTHTMVNYLHHPERLRISSLKELCLIYRHEMGPLNANLDEIMSFVVDEQAPSNRDYLNLGLISEDLYLPFLKQYIENFQSTESPYKLFQHVRLLGSDEVLKSMRHALEARGPPKEIHGVNEFIFEVSRSDGVKLLIEINSGAFGQLQLKMIR